MKKNDSQYLFTTKTSWHLQNITKVEKTKQIVAASHFKMESIKNDLRMIELRVGWYHNTHLL